MKKIAALAIALPLFLLTASCASSPNWSGAESEAGTFVWSPSPGPRFWINVALLGGLVAYFAYLGIDAIRKREKDAGGGFGCLSFLLVFFGFLLYVNVRDFVWPDSYTIDSQGIRHTYYTNVWKTAKKTDAVPWGDLDQVYYSPHTTLAHTVWVKVFRSTGERVSETGGETSEGESGRVIHFIPRPQISSGSISEYVDPIEDIRLVLEKEYFDTSRPEWMGHAWSWIFGTEDYKASPEEEARLKAAIVRFMPGTLKAKLAPETRAYLGGPSAI